MREENGHAEQSNGGVQALFPRAGGRTGVSGGPRGAAPQGPGGRTAGGRTAGWRAAGWRGGRVEGRCQWPVPDWAHIGNSGAVRTFRRVSATERQSGTAHNSTTADDDHRLTKE
ncbi:hypothetical protein GCM10010524_16970 [Streptomyces mexicanus]